MGMEWILWGALNWKCREKGFLLAGVEDGMGMGLEGVGELGTSTTCAASIVSGMPAIPIVQVEAWCATRLNSMRLEKESMG